MIISKHYITLLIIISSFTSYTQTKEEIQQYYEEIVSNTEWAGKTTPKKFHYDIKIYVKGEISKELNDELNRIVKELNDLINTVRVVIIDDEDESNLVIFLGSPSDYIDYRGVTSEKRKKLKNRLQYNVGYFCVRGWDNYVMSSQVFLNTTRLKNDVITSKHILREELTQALGFPNDSYKYDDSIFQQRWTEVTEYSEIDREIIKLHYNKSDLSLKK